MNKVKVSCWKHSEIPLDETSDIVYYTIPRHAYGYDLISCLNCGEIYAYYVMASEYLMPLDEKLSEKNCMNCHKPLIENAKPYPDYYLSPNNQIKKSNYVRDGREEDIIIKRFWNLYS